MISFQGRTHLILSDEQLAEVSKELMTVKELGFDTETRPSFKKGEVFKVALVQLATQNDAYLIRLASITQYHFLKQIFESEQIIKIGVAIRQDIKQLRQIFDFTPLNFIELQELAKKQGLKNFGLKGMTEEVLQAKLSKKAKITNWEAPVLSDQQILYAATDAWIGLQIFQRLSETSNI